MNQSASSPASTGPAGPRLEAEVAAYYLLAMLVDAEGRGLPGFAITRIKLQRGAEGHPLDDVIVDAVDPRGQASGMDIQVKRAIRFSPADPVFAKVCGQIAETLGQKTADTRGLAIATSQSSRKIDGPYQDLLTWAARIGDAPTFFARLARPGAASGEMRTFVETLRANLMANGVTIDDEGLWRLLRRLALLVFDFTAPGSVMRTLVRELCLRALAPEALHQADDLWEHLVARALELAVAGGDATREDLRLDVGRRFPLAGLANHRPSLVALDEAASHAVADIEDRIAGAVLPRSERLLEIHDGLDRSRWIQITGAGGVGKSALLKHLASTLRRQSRIIVLTPDRTPAGGWTAYKSSIGFPGTAHELMNELAASGGGTILIDGLDVFSPGARATAMDLMAEAASAPGVSIALTTRARLLAGDENGPSEALVQALGSDAVVDIAELTAEEVEALREAAPGLGPLLSDSHPARDLSRNLYRLRRLASSVAPRDAVTETALAADWWDTGDGPEAGRRDRRRVLRALTEAAMAGRGWIEADAIPSQAIDALVASGSVRDLGDDRLVFAHDVLRDWAVARLLEANDAAISHLPLSAPALETLTRGVELWARAAAERDGALWRARLDAVSGPEAHGGWRRAALLSLVRGETIAEVLGNSQAELFADNGALLRTLIRTVEAVQVSSAAPFLRAMGVPEAQIPHGLMAPVGPGWGPLVRFLTVNAEEIPPRAIPDVLSLFMTWLSLTAGWIRENRQVVTLIYRWLEEAQTERGRGDPAAFGGAMDRDEIEALTSSLRLAASAFAAQAPEAAATYLRALAETPPHSAAVADAIKRPRSFAQAAPEALSHLSLQALIEPLPYRRRDRDSRRNGFTMLDHQLMPESPAQGPFISLLRAAPLQGVALIRDVVGHAISVMAGDDAMTEISLEGENGPIVVIALESYGLSRQSDSYAVGSALMALEAWGHERVSAGEPIADVVSDVLGSDGPVPGAFVLVAVDLLISHWSEAARVLAVPFVGSAELLAMDHIRATRDHSNSTTMFADLFGLGALTPEPGKGELTAAALQSRPSRGTALDTTVGHYVFDEGEVGAALRARINRAVERLAPATEGPPFYRPGAMALEMQRRLDPVNWTDETLADGRSVKLYQPSPIQKAGAKEALAGLDALNLDLEIGAALTDPARSGPSLAARAAERRDKPLQDDGNFDLEPQQRMAAAFLIARDADPALWDAQKARLTEVFETALAAPRDDVHGSRRIAHNPRAMAFAGLAHAYRRRPDADMATVLLTAAARGERDEAAGFAQVAEVLAEVDPRLVEALVRVAFSGSKRVHRHWDETDAQLEARASDREARASSAVSAEQAWLKGEAECPSWPDFVPKTPSVRRGIRLPGPVEPVEVPPVLLDSSVHPEPEDEDAFTDHQAAAAWLETWVERSEAASRLGPLVARYRDWTWTANGLGEAFEASLNLVEWNNVFVRALVQMVAFEGVGSVDPLEPLRRLAEKSLLALAPPLMLAIDTAYFRDKVLTTDLAVALRTQVARAVIGTRAWRSAAGRWTTGAEISFGPAAACLLFCEQPFSQPPQAYLTELGLERISPFASLVSESLVAGPSYLTAISILALLEVQATPDLLDALLDGAEAWIAAFPDSRPFWTDHRVGARTCRVLEAMVAVAPDRFRIGTSAARRLEALLPRWVALGVMEAHALEGRLSGPGR